MLESFGVKDVTKFWVVRAEVSETSEREMVSFVSNGNSETRTNVFSGSGPCLRYWTVSRTHPPVET